MPNEPKADRWRPVLIAAPDVEEHLSHGIGRVIDAAPKRKANPRATRLSAISRASGTDRASLSSFGTTKVALAHCGEGLIQARAGSIRPGQTAIHVDSICRNAERHQGALLSSEVLLVRGAACVADQRVGHAEGGTLCRCRRRLCQPATCRTRGLDMVYRLGGMDAAGRRREDPPAAPRRRHRASESLPSEDLVGLHDDGAIPLSAIRDRGIVAATVDGAAVAEESLSLKLPDDGATHHVLVLLGLKPDPLVDGGGDVPVRGGTHG
jgi:hypothetical protein